jgi:archaellum biogenesis protein FlaJ (TadC family)
VGENSTGKTSILNIIKLINEIGFKEIKVLNQAVQILRQELRITTQRVNLFEKIKIPEIKALLLRFSNTLASGEDVVSFLSRESYILGESYSSSYERKIDVLKKWADAYVSLILTMLLTTL